MNNKMKWYELRDYKNQLKSGFTICTGEHELYFRGGLYSYGCSKCGALSDENCDRIYGTCCWTIQKNRHDMRRLASKFKDDLDLRGIGLGADELLPTVWNIETSELYFADKIQRLRELQNIEEPPHSSQIFHLTLHNISAILAYLCEDIYEFCRMKLVSKDWKDVVDNYSYDIWGRFATKEDIIISSIIGSGGKEKYMLLGAIHVGGKLNYNRILCSVIRVKFYDCIEIIIESTAVESYDNALELTCHIGETKLVKLFLDKGANPNATNHSNEPILHLAVKQGNNEIIKHIINFGGRFNHRINIDPNDYSTISQISRCIISWCFSNKDTRLIELSKEGYSDIIWREAFWITILLARGFFDNTQDVFGHIQIDKASEPIILEILKAIPYTLTHINDVSPSCIVMRSIEFIDQLISMEYDIHKEDQEGNAIEY